MNKLYQSLMGNRGVNIPSANPNLQFIKNILGSINSSSNPMQVIMNLASRNPAIKNTINIANQSGKSFEQLFYDLAREKGVDPNSIINQLKS